MGSVVLLEKRELTFIHKDFESMHEANFNLKRIQFACLNFWVSSG